MLLLCIIAEQNMNYVHQLTRTSQSKIHIHAHTNICINSRRELNTQKNDLVLIGKSILSVVFWKILAP
jgi:hypothetical protein